MTSLAEVYVQRHSFWYIVHHELLRNLHVFHENQIWTEVLCRRQMSTSDRLSVKRVYQQHKGLHQPESELLHTIKVLWSQV